MELVALSLSDDACFRNFKKTPDMNVTKFVTSLVLFLITVGGSLSVDAVTITASSAFDTRCFSPFLKGSGMPDWNFNNNSFVSYSLRTFGAAGDDLVTQSPVCSDVNPAITISAGALPTGTTLTTTNLNNALISGTPTGTGAVNFTVRYGNSVGAAVTDPVGGTLTASGGGTPIPNGTAAGVTRFVDCNASAGGGGAGNDLLDGQTPGTPWGTLTKVQAALPGLAAGTDIWLKAGSTCSGQTASFKLNGTGTNGTATDPAILGSYYVSGGVAFINSPTNYTVSRRPSAYTYTSPRPRILGSYHPSCRQSNALNTSANKCAWNTAGHAIDPNTGTPGTAVPAAYGDYLVQVTGKYLVVQDLDIEDSAGRTLGVFPDPSTGANFGYCFWDVRCDVFGFVQRNKLGHTPEEGLLIFGAHNVVRQNEFFLTIMRYADRPTGFLLGQAGGSALVHAFCDPCYGLDEGNDFWGVLEAIGNYGVSAILERGNWGGSSSRVGYSANRNASMVFEQNIWVGGTADSLDPLDRTANAGAEAGATFWPFGNEGGAGPIALSASNGGYYRILTGGASNGDQAGSKIVRRNNVAQTVGERCFNQYLDIGGFTDQNPAQRIATTDVGNTCFTDLYTDYMDFTNNVLSQVNFYTAKNNLFVVSSSQSCLQYPGTGQFTFDYNQYTISPTGAVNNGDVCKSAHDVNSATTGLPGSFNWHTASWSSFPAESDFLPNNTDPGKAAGLAMTGAMFTYADPVWGHVDGSTGGGDSWWGWVLRQRVWLPACNVSGVQVTEAEWSKLLTTDYCGEARTTMTMGARNASP